MLADKSDSIVLLVMVKKADGLEDLPDFMAPSVVYYCLLELYSAVII